MRYYAYLKGQSKDQPTEFKKNWELARLINVEFGAEIVTPWSVDRMPAEDLWEILYWIDLREQLRGVREEEVGSDKGGTGKGGGEGRGDLARTG